jgi:hypothetical protein
MQQLAATATDPGNARRGRRQAYSVVGMQLRTDPAEFAGRAAAQ